MKFSFTVENTKTCFTSQYMCATVEAGMLYSCSEEERWQATKISLHGMCWAEAFQYMPCVEYKWSLEG